MGIPNVEVNAANQWRLETPGSTGWERSVRPGAENKYFIISTDAHSIEPPTLWLDNIDPKFRDRLPRLEQRDGKTWMIQEGAKPFLMTDNVLEGEDAYRQKPPHDMETRMRDMDIDGIDHEILFPNRGSVMYATHDADYAMAQIRVYNDWVMDFYGKYPDRFTPVAFIFTGSVQHAVDEIRRAIDLGFKAINIPPKPVFGPHARDHLNYNLSDYDPMWALIEEAGLAVTTHVGSGQDPRIAKGPGGAIVNFAVHAIVPACEPVANIIASGLLDRFPKLRFVTVEAQIGWVAWFCAMMDAAHTKHHFWVKPKLKHGLPSDYYREHFASTFMEDPIGIELARTHDLMNNIFFATDYPHHEGSFPHTAQCIERQMGDLTDAERANILGLNAAKFFNIEVPEKYLR